mgnify:CR=1 FL=1|jgi:hypothetical protein
MIKEYEISKVTHEWCESNDRWIYIEYNAQRKIIGLNFMQGDEYDYFKAKWCHNDQALMQFYGTMLYTFPIEKASVNTLEFINKVMWSYHSAIVANEDHSDYGEGLRDQS